MKAKSFLFLLFIFSAITVSAQGIETVINKYGSDYAQERTYLHYDKSSYSPGETVWFKAYLMKGIDPADDSKTFYVDWTDDAGKLLYHTVAPVVDATSNGQFDIPADYKGQYIHVKAYTRWMLNFDSSFLYEKDIRVITKDNIKAAGRVIATPSLEFFPEGGDAVAGIMNKIAFKANDQWGKPVKIRGIIQNSRGEKIDSLKVRHDGMGFVSVRPVTGETYVAKWKDEKGAEHTTKLPVAKAKGLVLQVTTVSNKRNFTILADGETAKELGTVNVVGTMNQLHAFKVSKDISSGTAGGIIPTVNLPSGILTITVFDSRWNALAERITYINNDEYRFNAGMTVDHWGLNKRAKNEIQVEVPDSVVANLSIAITDASIDSDSSNTIISHFLLSSELKGQIYNPAYYFSGNDNTIAQHLDLVMLSHGWRRFKWEDVAKNKLPSIAYPRDTAFLALSGKVYGATPSALRENPTVILIVTQKKDEMNTSNKKPIKNMLIVPVKPDGTFEEPNFFLFDSAHIYYKLSKSLRDASIIFMENRLPAIRYRLPAAGLFNNQFGDTTGYGRHFQLSDETLRLLQLGEGKILENVTVKTKTRSPLEIMDQKYSSGLFTGGDGYQFNLLDDNSSFASRNIFEYLQSKVAGLMINTSANPPTMSWRGGSPQLFLDELPMDAEFVSSISINDVAYIKVFRPPFYGGGSSANGAIAIYTRRGDDVKQDPGKGLANNTVNGYTPLRQFYSPNYSAFNAENEKPDMRTTIFWNPQVITKPGANKVKMIFYNNDVSKSFRVIIEGMTTTGQLVHLEQIME